jgi:cobalt/nickel transport system ATP-binding protein
MTDLIELKGIAYSYPDGTNALNGVDLRIGGGGKIAFLGENGSGKSTLFLILNGIHRATGGEYYFKGERIKYGKEQLSRLVRSVGVVFQDPDIQIFASSVFQDISFGPKNMGLPDSEVKRRVEYSMGMTDLTLLGDRPPHFLSYGEKKRVAIADILAIDPEVIILDEPMAWLDLAHKRKITGILENLSRNSKTVMISTHDPDFAFSWADHVYIMKGGKVIGHGAPEEIFLDRELVAEAGLEVPFIVELAWKLKLKKIPRKKSELLSVLGG